jgi:hypothetical protein
VINKIAMIALTISVNLDEDLILHVKTTTQPTTNVKKRAKR